MIYVVSDVKGVIFNQEANIPGKGRALGVLKALSYKLQEGVFDIAEIIEAIQCLDHIEKKIRGRCWLYGFIQHIPFSQVNVISCLLQKVRQELNSQKKSIEDKVEIKKSEEIVLEEAKKNTDNPFEFFLMEDWNSSLDRSGDFVVKIKGNLFCIKVNIINKLLIVKVLSHYEHRKRKRYMKTENEEFGELAKVLMSEIITKNINK